MKKTNIQNIISIVLILLLINLGLFTALLYIYDPIQEAGYSVFVLSNENPNSLSEKVPENHEASRNLANATMAWADKYDARAFFQDIQGDGTYYFSGKADNTFYYSASKDLLERLNASGYDNVLSLPAEFTNLPFAHSDLFVPMQELPSVDGFLYVDNTNSEVLELYDSIVDIDDLTILQERSDILPMNLFKQIISLPTQGVLAASILLGIIILLVFTFYLIFSYLKKIKPIVLIKRLFGMSKRSFIKAAILNILIILFIVFILTIVLSMFFLEAVGANYLFKVLRLIFTVDLISLFLVFLVLIAFISPKEILR